MIYHIDPEGIARPYAYPPIRAMVAKMQRRQAAEREAVLRRGVTLSAPLQPVPLDECLHYHSDVTGETGDVWRV